MIPIEHGPDEYIAWVRQTREALEKGEIKLSLEIMQRIKTKAVKQRMARAAIMGMINRMG